MREVDQDRLPNVSTVLGIATSYQKELNIHMPKFRLYTLITIILLCSCNLSAQFTSTARHITWGPVVPATCNPNTGDVFFKTSATIGLNYCSASNTWSAVGSGGGSAAWGSITGTLSAQTDLQAALDAKVIQPIRYVAARCQNTVANAAFSLPTLASGLAPTATCAGTNSVYGLLQFTTATLQTVYDHFRLPLSWDPTVKTMDLQARWLSSATTGVGNWTVSNACVRAGSDPDPTLSNTDNFASTAPNGTAGRLTFTSKTTLTLTGCQANDEIYFKFSQLASSTAVTPSLFELVFLFN